MQNNKREYGLDLLRIVAMFFIVYIHFISHANGFTPNNTFDEPFYLLEKGFSAFGGFRVNVFILISGYFLINKTNFDSKEKFKKIWSQTWFYSVLIFAIACFTGIELVWKDKLAVFLPFLGYRYWFMTCYLVIILLAPFVNRAVKDLTQKQYKRLVLVVLGVMSLWQTFLPFFETIDRRNGLSVWWLLALYIVGGYIGKFYRDIKIKKSLLFLIYIVASFAQFCYSCQLEWINKTYVDAKLSIPDYNNIFVVIASICIFLIFKQLKINEKIGETISVFSGSVFAAYLLTDNASIRRTFYMDWLKMGQYWNTGFKSVGMIFFYSLIILIVAVYFDLIRKLIARKIGGFLIKSNK